MFRYVFLSFLLSIASALYAQLDLPYDILDSVLYTNRGKTQLTDYKNHLNIFPPRPKDGWELGIQAGLVNIFGDIGSRITPLGISLSARKSLGYLLSLRGQYGFGVAQGRNDFPTFDFANDAVYQRYNGNITGGVYRNYRTLLHTIGVQALWNLSNVSFHGVRQKLHFYALTGIEVIFYTPAADAFNGATLYNFDNFNVNDFNNNYESPADVGSSWAMGFSLGAGMQYVFSEKLNLQLENKVTLANRHDLDGSRYTGVNNPTFQSNNILNYVSVGINYILKNRKKQVMSLWQINPLAHIYKELNTPRSMKLPPIELKDTDGDGIPDLFDREPNTLPGVPVDARGVTLDTDGDGVPDYNDLELITPSFCRPVNERGIGTCPAPPDTCCQNLRQYVQNLKTFSADTTPIQDASRPGTPADTAGSLLSDTPAITPQASAVLPVAKSPTTLPSAATPLTTLDNPACADALQIERLSPKILFELNSARILAISLLYLDDVVQILQKNPIYHLKIGAEAQPFEASPKIVARQRRQIILKYLSSQGIAPQRLTLSDAPKMQLFQNNTDILSHCSSKDTTNCYNAEAARILQQDKNFARLSQQLSLLSQQIRFDEPNDTLSSDSYAALQHLVGFIKKIKNYPLLITAPYTRSQHSEQYHKTQSWKRGTYLQQLLKKKGVPDKQLKILALNSYQPLNTVPLIRIFVKGQDSDHDCTPDEQDECPTLAGNPENSGCIISTAVQDSLNLIVKNVYFDFDQSVLSDKSMPYLDQLVAMLKKHQFNLVIAGSTDTTGSAAYNLELSFKRAIGIKQYLVSKGIPAHTVKALGLGERKSLRGDEAELRHNRRVEFWIKY